MERCCWSSYCWQWARLQPTSQAMASRYTLVCAVRPKRIAVPTDKAGKLGSCSDRRRFGGIMQHVVCKFGTCLIMLHHHLVRSGAQRLVHLLCLHTYSHLHWAVVHIQPITRTSLLIVKLCNCSFTTWLGEGHCMLRAPGVLSVCNAKGTDLEHSGLQRHQCCCHSNMRASFFVSKPYDARSRI